MNAVGDLGTPQGCRSQMLTTAIDALTIHKRVMRSHRDGMRITRVAIIEIAVTVAATVEIVEIGVVDVDVVPVAPAAAIPRMVGFTPTEREPAIATAPTEADSKTKATQESDKGRAVVRIGVDRAGAPTPVGAKIVPAAVVVRSKTPRFIANPSPSPRGDIRPVAVAVGGPVVGLVVGDPDVAVVWFLPPSAVIVEVAIADDIAIYVLCGGGIVLARCPVVAPTDPERPALARHPWRLSRCLPCRLRRRVHRP